MVQSDTIEVTLWGERIGVVSWEPDNAIAAFQYDPTFIKKGVEISPIVMPLNSNVYRFPIHTRSETFVGLPGLLADSLTEKFGNNLMATWLARKGLTYNDLSPIEKLCYIGSRGMGALEFVPEADTSANTVIGIEIDELALVAQEVLNQHEDSKNELNDNDKLHSLIQVGTSAGGAKAKAIIALNSTTNEVMSGQAECPEGFDHWILKFSEIENSEHYSDSDVGRLEYAYYLMALDAGITMMESRLLDDGSRAHFMTRRFDRYQGHKIHVQTFCGIAHQDRNPAGNTHYETLFLVARKLGLTQPSLDELYRRMVFSILARNQDDHSKNHAFMMDGTGNWRETPAYDITFSYNKNSRWIAQQQMSCNGKRDNFIKKDLLAAADAADVRRPGPIIEQVEESLKKWDSFAISAGLPQKTRDKIGSHFRWL
ncbi:MAG: type II toxin-antitoxin system HipA family toxin [Fibrobacterales bacterium]